MKEVFIRNAYGEDNLQIPSQLPFGFNEGRNSHVNHASPQRIVRDVNKPLADQRGVLHTIGSAAP
jgi:hypothetical protein